MSKGIKTRKSKGDFTPDDNNVMIHHGYESHSVAFAKRRKCEFCNKIQDDFHKQVKEAGGLGEYIKKLKKEQEENLAS